MITDDTLYLGVREIGRMLRSGKTSSVELTRLALHRLETHGRALNAVASLLEQRALAEAAQADRELRAGKDRGPLHGIPYGAKDLLAAKGGPTEYGSHAFKGQRLDYDSAVVKRLKNAGAVLVAKLSMVSLAGGGGYRYAHASLTGPGRNPWDANRWSGGSSSGPGSAVGAGLVPYAIGSETWGSIVCPSAFCGITGLRPTYGRVPRSGAMALSWTMDKIGPMARYAEDASLVLAAISSPDPEDPSSLVGSYTHPARNRRNLRVGVLKENFEKGDPAAGKAYEAALKALSATGLSLKDTALPELPYGVVAATIVTIEGTAAFENIVTGPKLALLNTREQRTGLAAGLAMTGEDYLHAMRLRPKCQRGVARVFENFDVLVAPSYTGGAPPVDENLDTSFPVGNGLLQAAGNCVGIPCFSVPMGYDTNGMPLGLQIAADAGNERAAVEVTRLFQSRTHWHTDRPKAFR